MGLLNFLCAQDLSLEYNEDDVFSKMQYFRHNGVKLTTEPCVTFQLPISKFTMVAELTMNDNQDRCCQSKLTTISMAHRGVLSPKFSDQENTSLIAAPTFSNYRNEPRAVPAKTNVRM